MQIFAFGTRILRMEAVTACINAIDKHRSFQYIFFLAALAITGCTGEAPEKPADDRLHIVTTTGMIRDAAANIAGDAVIVESLMGSGVDPHLYKATPGDLHKLNEADIILYNGLHLEGKMGEALEKLARTKPVIAVAETLPTSSLIKVAGSDDTFDPHIWFDIALWGVVARAIGDTLQTLDSVNAARYAANTRSYLHTLDSLDSRTRAAIAQIPAQQRVLVTAHDAFGYFGRAYDIEVEGLQGISTVAEFGLQDISRLKQLIVKRGIKAVFVETSVSDQAIRAVIDGCRDEGHSVAIGGQLFSDAMGADGTPEGTYIGMVSSNVNTIVGALR